MKKHTQQFNKILCGNKYFLKKILMFTIVLLISSFANAQNCAVNAGLLTENICEGDLGLLVGNDPMPRIGNVQWTQVSGPSVIINTPNATSSTVSGMVGVPGGNDYVFRYSATCGDGIVSFQDKTITVFPITLADAGVDRAECPGTISINGNTPLNVGETGAWVPVGPDNGGVTINSPNSESSTVTLDPNSCGTTTFAWVITGPDYAPGQFCETRSEINITNYGGELPVSAGSDIPLSNCYSTTQSTNLSGSFGGCGLNGQEGTWAFVSGPSNPTFSVAEIHSPTMSVSDLVEGVYCFRWSVTGPCASGEDVVCITVPAPTQDLTPVPGNRVNINICDTNITELNLDGVIPEFAGEQVTWLQTSGPAVTIVSPNSPSTLVTGLVASNTYNFSYTLENTSSLCSDSRNYRIRYRDGNNTISANGGNDLIGACGQTAFTIPFTNTGNGRNRYQILSGPASSPLAPFPTSFSNTGNNNLNIDLFVEGTYVFNFNRRQGGVLQVGCEDGFDSINVVVSSAPITSNAGTPVSLPCGATFTTLSGNATTDEVSLWSQISGPNLALIATPYTDDTLVSGLISGTYVFQYKIQGGGTSCPNEYSEVTINVSSSSLTASTIAINPVATCSQAPVVLTGNSPGPGEFGLWTQISGPMPFTVSFSDPNDPNAIASGFDELNATYVLEWVIDYSNPGPTGCATTSPAQVTINTGPNVSPIASTGGDMCLSSGTTSFNLTGNPLPATQTGLWTVVPAVGLNIVSPTDPTSLVNVVTEGSYELTWTVTDNSPAACAAVSEVISVIISDPVVSDAGLDQQVCAISVMMNANILPGSVGTWSFISGTGDFLISDVNDPNATITFSYSDTYVFEWLLESGTCSSNTNQVTIEVGIPITDPIDQPNIEVCNVTNVSLTGTDFNAFTEIGSWSVLPGAPNNPNFSAQTSFMTNVSNLITGTYTFRWTISGIANSICPSKFDDIIVEVAAPSTTDPTQLNFDLCNVTSAMLPGVENSTGTWTCTGANCAGTSITYENDPINNSFNATASNLVPGNIYEFTYTPDPITFGSGAICNQTIKVVTLDISAAPSMPPFAGMDQLLCTGDLVGGVTTLNGSDPTGIVAPADAVWNITFQPPLGVANILAGDENNPNATIENLTVPGIYLIEWVYSNGNCVRLADEIRIELFEPPTIASAGTDDLLACELSYQTNATPATVGIGTWSFANPADDPSGGTINIDNPNNPVTTLSNITVYGTYVLTWTVSNGPFLSPSLCTPSVDTVTVVFNDAVPTTSDAGPDQLFCQATQTNLAAIPPASGIGTWSQTGGTSVLVTNPTDPTSLVLGLTPGTYEFTWTTGTVGSNGCFFTDVMEVVITDQPVIAEAGPDQTLLAAAPVILGATPVTVGVGTWSQVSGPNTANFTDINDPFTSVTGIGVGIYVFEWTVANPPCNTISDIVTIEIKSNADLELSKSVTPTAVSVGDVVTFTIDVFNNNLISTNTDASGVEVQDMMPSGFTIIPGSISNGGSFDSISQIVTWSGLSILNGATQSLTFQATVNISTGVANEYLNSAQITNSDQYDPDSDPNTDDTVDEDGDGNGDDDDEDTVLVTLLDSDLEITKSVLPVSGLVGDTVTFSILIDNNGPGNGTGIDVLDLLPSGFNLVPGTVSNSGVYAVGNNSIQWSDLTIANGGSLTVTYDAIVTSTANYTNTVQINGADSIDPDSTPDNDDGDQSEDDEDSVDFSN